MGKERALLMQKKAVVVHSGGMDSSLCLAMAVKEFGEANVLSLSFTYNQRHATELDRAQKISEHFKVDHVVINLDCLSQITESALIGNSKKIEHKSGEAPNTLVVGRNGLMARLAGIHAHSLGANCIYMGVIQTALRMDFDNNAFEIRTPLVSMTKKETMELGFSLRVLGFLLENTITCYEGIEKAGCLKCPACKLRNSGLKIFSLEHPEFKYSYREQILNFIA